MRAFVYRPRMATSMPGMSLAFFMDIPDFLIDEGQRHPGMNRYQCICLCELPCARSEKVRSKLGIYLVKMILSERRGSIDIDQLGRPG